MERNETRGIENLTLEDVFVDQENVTEKQLIALLSKPIEAQTILDPKFCSFDVVHPVAAARQVETGRPCPDRNMAAAAEPSCNQSDLVARSQPKPAQKNETVFNG